jgi:hypothetical protein
MSMLLIIRIEEKKKIEEIYFEHNNGIISDEKNYTGTGEKKKAVFYIFNKKSFQ